ncbi:hypothetical protein SUGI_1057930 [Cryptomeria japonica]|uniref:GATA transcription factor 19 n=1 Tax=Cryptomeria japonica TaxID=3369 RepID=UPI002414A468|nr:GATA transcription factor 19 [Cryptomeria japonica]GLJ49808.1 hypothetical protein SUGI_1057930 [Cryptomeria japonica]
MLQGRAAYLSPPVYGHSHFKKFWLKKMETEDDSEASATPPAEGVVLTKKPPLYAVNCTALEMKGTSPPPAAIKAPVPAPAEEKIKYMAQESELDYTLALGVGLPLQEEEDSHSYDGFSSGEEKIDKFAGMAEEEAQPPNLVYGNGESNGQGSLAVAKMCADCKTVKTPLWRNGPQGPKTLCNACGIRYKKMGKRPSSNGDRPSSPSTPPISPSCKNKINGKRKRDREIYSGEQQEQQHHNHHHHQRKKMKSLAGGRSSMVPSCSLQSEADSSPGGEENRAVEALRRWRRVERIRKGLLRYGVMRNSMAKDEEEGAMLLMALSWGVASC